MIAPNPVHEKIKLLFDRNIPIDKMVITDMSGKKIIEIHGYTKDIEVQQLEKGLYLLEVFSEGTVYRNKFIKN